MKFKIYSPSYKRSKIAITHHLFPKKVFCYVVREEEAHLYKPLGVELKIIPTGKVSNISNTRNWILENKESDYVTMVDDDMKSIKWLLHRKFRKFDQSEIMHIFENGYQMAEDAKCGIWGMNMLPDPKSYRTYSPVSFSLPILGPLINILDCSIKYDETLTLKEDYDLFLQHIKKHRKALRFNFLFYDVDHLTLPGGCQTYRTSQREKEQNILLQKKWGSDIVRENTVNPGSINMIIKTGLGA